MNEKVCGNCVKYLNPDECPRAEYKSRKRNRIACLPTDNVCEKFQPRKGSSSKRESQADALVKLALENAEKLFHDDRQEPYIRILKGEALASLRLRSKEVKTWLAGLLWEDRQKAPNTEALGAALNVLEAIARKGEERKLYNRVALDEDRSIWLDLADDKWRAIHITKDGWEVVDKPPILFRRYSHQKPIPVPTRGGDLRLLFEYANIRYLGDQLLYAVDAITYLIPGIPHVIMVFFGPQGSGKTWSLRAVRIVIDPSLLDLLSLPRREREVVQNLDHHWCAFYDNVGSLPPWCSNVFCRAVTGTGVSKRALYTDDDDVIYNYYRCVGLTDINVVAKKGDLLERSLLLGLTSMPKTMRKTEEELKTKLESERRSILGAMLDVLVRAIRIYPKIKLESMNRMADFVMWGCAITEALGLDKQYFLDAYEENINAQNLEVVRASPISDALIKLMEDQRASLNPGTWEGTPSQLYSELEEKAKELKISTRQKAWPKKPHILTRRLNELAPSLPSIGYEIETTRSGKSRKIFISSVTSVTSVTRKPDWGKGPDLKAYLKPNYGDASDGNDDSFESLSVNAGVSKSTGFEYGTLQKSKIKPSTPEKMSKTWNRKPTLRELEELLRSNWQKGTTEQLIELIHQNSDYDKIQASEYVTKLIEEGKIAYDPDGWLKWT